MRLSLSLTNNMSLKGSRALASNLLKYSQKLDNVAWEKAVTTISADATTAPDGTLTADKMVESNTTANQSVEQVTTKAASALQCTASGYVKPSGRDWVYILVYDGTNGNRVWFNVTTGAVGSSAAIGSGFTGVTGSIEAAANGFYRCKVTFTTTTSTTLHVRFAMATADAGTTYLGNGANGAFIWGAQLETGDVATAYVAREA